MKEVIPGQKPRIIVVDDDFDVLYTMSALLDNAGAEITKFNKAAPAIEHLKNNCADLILSDIKMPGINGIEFLSAAHDIAPDTPFILMTGFAEMDSAIQSIKNGAFDYLLKPIDPEILHRAIDKALTVRRAGYLEKNYLEQLESDLLTRTAQLRTSLEELQLTLEKTTVAERAKSEFMANVRHELRTPMNAIIGCLDLLSGPPPLAPDQHELLEAARTSAAEMMELLNRLIAYADLAASKRSQVSAKFSIRNQLAETLQIYQARAATKSLAFTCEIGESVPDILIGDYLAYLQLVESLVDNAVKFTPAGNVSVAVSAVPSVSNGCLIQTVVADTGIGIPFDCQLDVMKGLKQADGSYTRKFGGIGIGLATANQLVKSLAGDLHCNSVPDEGSRFCFTIPFRIPPQESAGEG